ncbi:hypothetical protein HanRHA438_Chr11g0498361 [Helianthus annuus]|nr:hypothetical protein HanHA300_Chr11g0397971 [Helianthus annuus]KAJ0508921.1 hypothetical protein HanIR_Chr11g0522781 [Helianthus annuus]KAJ0517087.1 hypothetical protein HanHA89_Chr11g0421261 [Helianthus annuus]KAJ0685095.1 hypothetical protein HanLR1_Chr11g0398671 [Helianthus annuus]KAJ0689013.1 hypothetical protein HanOQP8_Chr11g0400781 [Helianthus annuus]
MDSVETEVRVENLQADNIQNTGCDNRSFKDTLLNKPVEVTIPEVIVDSEGKAFDDLYDVGLVAKVSSFGMFSSLRKLLKEVAKTQCDIKYEKEVFLGNREVWKDWFLAMEPWSGQYLEVGRIAWLKYSVYHFRLRRRKCLMVLQLGLGKWFNRLNSWRMETYLALVLVKWKELMFEVLVEEDVGEWVPDCVIDLLDDEEITLTEQIEMNNGNGNAVQSGNGIVVEPHLNGVFDDNVQEPISSKSGKRKGEIF